MAYVSITGLELKSVLHAPAFWWHAIRSMGQVQSAPRLISAGAEDQRHPPHPDRLGNRSRDARLPCQRRTSAGNEGVSLHGYWQDHRLSCRSHAKLRRGLRDMAQPWLGRAPKIACRSCHAENSRRASAGRPTQRLCRGHRVACRTGIPQTSVLLLEPWTLSIADRRRMGMGCSHRERRPIPGVVRSFTL
jgi:hypothetical protein